MYGTRAHLTRREAKELAEKKAAAGLIVKPVQAIDALRKILVDIKKGNPGNDEGVATCFKTFLAYLVRGGGKGGGGFVPSSSVFHHRLNQTVSRHLLPYKRR